MLRIAVAAFLAAVGLVAVSATAQTVEVGLTVEAFDGCGCIPLDPPNCPPPEDLRWPFREDWWTYQLNITGPTVVSEVPARRTAISSLSTVEVTFSEAVTGVTAGLLKVNNRAATTVSGSGAGPYSFSGFSGPGDGVVRVELGSGSITGASGAFGGAYWTYQKNRPHWITVASVSPAMDSSVSSLSSVQVTFSEAVTGVLPSHCQVGGSAATVVTGSGAGPYEFTGFTTPANGVVRIELGRGSVPVIFAEATTGCNCHEASLNFPNPTACVNETGWFAPFPNMDVYGSKSVDQDWANRGWSADFAEDYVIKNGVEPANQASQRFEFRAGQVLDDHEWPFPEVTLGYISPENPQEQVDNWGYMRIEQIRQQYNANHPDTPLPEPILDAPAYLTVDVRRVGDGFGGTDPNNPLLAMYPDSDLLWYQPEPTGLVVTKPDPSTRMIPNDATWHTYRIANFDRYPTKLLMQLRIDLDGTSQGFPATTTQGVQIWLDNLRLVYTAYPFPENCSNGSDDDGDGKFDCDDEDCYFTESCPCNPLVIFDIDNDTDVDQSDFAFLQACLTGPGDPGQIFGSLSAACKCLDVAGTSGVPDFALDQQDLLAFEACASGPGVEAALDCDD